NVIGVIPRSLVLKEVAHSWLTELRIVGSMHERKTVMSELCDAFVTLPGGIGTLDEIFEIWTWGQLGHHDKPCAIYNVAGYYDALVGFLDAVTRNGFLKPAHREMLIVEDTTSELLDSLRSYRAPITGKCVASPQA